MIKRREAKKRNVRGKNGDPNRGTWCTPKAIAEAVGPFDLDPFSNPRSHIISSYRCMLEDGGDGFGGRRAPGSYQCGGRHPLYGEADAATRVWIQPPYDIVLDAFAHYQHTRWCALLRFDPRPEWFRRVYRASQLVCVFRKINFEPPPGVRASSNTFPHALFYARAEDATPAVLRMCIAWRTR